MKRYLFSEVSGIKTNRGPVAHCLAPKKEKYVLSNLTLDVGKLQIFIQLIHTLLIW